MNIMIHRSVLVSSLAIILFCSVLLPSMTGEAYAKGEPPSKESATTYSGRAVGVLVDTAILDVKVADTGELPSKGGVIDATVASIDHSLVDAQVLLSVTMGFDNKAQSEVATASVALLPDANLLSTITADLVRAKTVAVCDGVSGTSEIVNLKLGGKSIEVTGKPNQQVTVPGLLTLTINEQIISSSGKTQSITVNALHLKLATGEEVIVSGAHSDITCGKLVVSKKDFVTGGGFIAFDEGKASFGFVVGFKPGKTTLEGNLNYIDHSTGMHLKSSGMTSYSGTGDTRTFTGTATINGKSGYTFTAIVTDKGEPGKGVDEFSISISNGYTKSGTLGGGNIQLHT